MIKSVTSSLVVGHTVDGRYSKGPTTHGEELVDEVSTKCQRIVNEVSAKDFSSPAKFFLPKNFTETSSTKNF